MAFGIAAILMCGALAGIVPLAVTMRKSKRKIGHILGMIGCATVALGAAGYMALVAILLNAIP